MLALKDYGSSDEGSEPENENSSTTVEDEEVKDNIDADFASKPFAVDKLTTPINLQICSAPEVVPTVSIYVHIYFVFFLLSQICTNV